MLHFESHPKTLNHMAQDIEPYGLPEMTLGLSIRSISELTIESASIFDK